MTMWHNKYRAPYSQSEASIQVTWSISANQRSVLPRLWPIRGQYSGHPSPPDHWVGHWNSQISWWSIFTYFHSFRPVPEKCQALDKVYIQLNQLLTSGVWKQSVLRINNSNTQTLLFSYLMSLTVMRGVPISRCYAGTRTNECMFSSQVSKYGPHQPSPVCQNNPPGNN